MATRKWGKRWATLALACGLTGTTARAQESATPDGEPLLRAQASVLASDLLLPGDTPSGQPVVFLPVLNAGVGLRSTRERRGWLLGTDVSVSAGLVGVKDNSSTLFVRYRPSSWRDGEEAALTLYPLSSTRLRMGWSYLATLGGGVYARQQLAPGLRAEVTRTHWSAFAAVKAPGGPGLHLAPLVGAGLTLLPSLRAEVQAGLFPGDPLAGAPWIAADGSITGLPPADATPTNAPGYVRGASARLLHQQGEPIGPGVDFGLRGRAPEVFEESFHRERYPGGIAHSVSLEATHATLSQAARQSRDMNGNPLELPAVEASANALALEARVRWDWLRIHGLALVRSAAFVVADDSRLWPTLRWGPEREPELGLTVGADYHLAEAGLTPGLVLRVVRPAALRHEQDTGSTWSLLSPRDVRTGLPGGNLPSPVLSARATLKWDTGSWFAAVGELSYTQNLGAYSTDAGLWIGAPGTYVVPRRQGAGLGFNLLLQARY